MLHDCSLPLGAKRRFLLPHVVNNGVQIANFPKPKPKPSCSNSAEGYIMDHYCLYDTFGQTLLDTGDVTLEYPDRHTIHCLVDVGVCRAGPFYILGDPMMKDNGDLYTVDYVLDDAGRLTLIDLARAEGKCSTCMGDGALVRGYRAEVIGVVTALATAETPAIQLTLTSARTSNGLTDVCAGRSKPGTCGDHCLSTVCVCI
jgi:hypothetical protein